MALASNALVTMNEARDYVGSSAGDDPRLEAAVNRATELIEAYCDRPLRRGADPGPYAPKSIRLTGRDSLILPVAAGPIDVTKTVTVTVDGIAQTVWRKDADGDPDLLDVVVGYLSGEMFQPGLSERGLFVPDILFRRSGWGASRIGGIVISYYGALTATPDDLKDAALVMVRRLFDNQQKSLTDVVTINTPGGGVTLYDRWMPSETRAILDSRYKLWRVG